MRRVSSLVCAFWFLFLVNPVGVVWAQKVLSEGIKDLAAQIATSVAKQQKRKVAVLPFRDLSGQETVLGAYISEELATDLFAIGGLEIVERSMLDKIIGEFKLSQTGLIDPLTAKKVGKIAGVDAVISGSVTNLQSYVALNCRLIDVQSGSVFAAAQVKIAKDADVLEIMRMPLSGMTKENKPSHTQEPKSGTPVKKFAPQRQRVERWVVDLTECQVGDAKVTCEFLITDTVQDGDLILGTTSSRLVTAEGIDYPASEVAFGNRPAADRAELMLTSGVPMKGRIVYRAPVNIESTALLEIGFSTPSVYGWYKAQFRNVEFIRP